MDSAKKFGLVMPKKAETLKVKAKSIFDSDSEDDAPKGKRPKIPQKKIDFKSKMKKETLEDPSIYEYDSIYDDIKAKQAESIAPKEKQNSRYIDTLLKAADKRKKEYERRLEKKIQLERVKEGDQFKDKEEFVTSTYKKKMQEREEEEERERREAMLNDMMDVTKQKDLSGFYRHFLKQTVGEEKVPKFGEKFIKQEVTSEEEKSSENIKAKSAEKAKEKSNENTKVNPVIKIEEECNIKMNKKSELSKANIIKDKEHIDFEDLDRDSDGIEIDSDDQNSDSSRKKTRHHSDSTSSDSYSQKANKSSKHIDTMSNAAKKIGDDLGESSSDRKNEDNNDNHKKKTLPSSNMKTKSDCNADSGENGSKTNESNKHGKNKSSNLKSPKSVKYEKQFKIYRKAQNSNSDSESETENALEKVIGPQITDEETADNRVRSESKEDKTKHLRHDSSDDSREGEIALNYDEKIDNSTNKKKVRRNIYAKRTVGDIFAQAQARYFQRMADRNS